MMKNKKGSHVGVILSFVMFVTFLVFLYSLLGPQINPSDKDSFLDFLRLELLDRFTANLTRITISTESTASCIKLNGLIGLGEINSKTIVKNSDGEIVNSEISSDEEDLLIEDDDDFFRVYNSEVFDEISTESIPCTELEETTGYSITLRREEEYIFLTRVNELLEDYSTQEGYETLKDELKIPTGTEFGMTFLQSNGTLLETKEKEISDNIFAREIPVQYVDGDANILLGTINIKVW